MEPGWDFNGALLNQITVRNARQGDPHRATAVVGHAHFWRQSPGQVSLAVGFS